MWQVQDGIVYAAAGDLSISECLRKYKSDENHFKTALVYSRDNFCLNISGRAACGAVDPMNMVCYCPRCRLSAPNMSALKMHHQHFNWHSTVP